MINAYRNFSAGRQIFDGGENSVMQRRRHIVCVAYHSSVVAAAAAVIAITTAVFSHHVAERIVERPEVRAPRRDGSDHRNGRL